MKSLFGLALGNAAHRGFCEASMIAPPLLGLPQYLLAALVTEVHGINALPFHLGMIMRDAKPHILLHALAARAFLGGRISSAGAASKSH